MGPSSSLRRTLVRLHSSLSHASHTGFYKHTHPLQRAFTLVEMLVVLSIIAVITMIALIGQGDFNRSILITDTAYTVALSLREMQTLGLSSRKFTDVQNAGYGGYFTTTPTGRGSYILFADTYNDPGIAGVQSNCVVGTANTPEAKPGDCLYTAGSDGIVRRYAFSRNFTVNRLCGTAGGVRSCTYTELSAAFLRSSTESMMEGKIGAGSWVPLTKAEIYINSGNGGTRGICVSQVGQISVAYNDCP